MNYPSLETVPHEWNPGDVILDLYEVQPVTEGHLETLTEKRFHEGGFGRVYKVWHRSWQRHLAVKCPKPTVWISQEARAAFNRECETWVNINLHPNVTACHYIRDLGGSPRVFSEYADAGTLADWIVSGRLYEGEDIAIEKRILDLSIQFAWGLHHAHESGVIHQDVKSLNALMWENGTLKVTDFGIGGTRFASNQTEHKHFTQTLMVTSGSMTPSHCSPEQLAGKKLDRRTDMWSWAVCILEMYNGGVTWISGAAADNAFESYLEYGPAIDSIPRIPDSLIPIIRSCLCHNPDDRPRTLAECARLVRDAFINDYRCDYQRPEPMVVNDSSENLNNKAISLIDLGCHKEAEAAFRLAVKKSPSSREISYNSNLYKWRTKLIAANEFLHSLDSLKTNSGSNPDSNEFVFGLVYYELGFYLEAIELLKENTTTNELQNSVLSDIKKRIELKGEYSNCRFEIKTLGELKDIQFAWDQNRVFLLTDKVYILDYVRNFIEEIPDFGTKLEWIQTLRHRRWLVAWDSSSWTPSKLLAWDSDMKSVKEIFQVHGKVCKVLDTLNNSHILAQIAYSISSMRLIPAHSKIQTIDLDAKSVAQDILDGACGADLCSTSNDAEIIVASLPLLPDGYSPQKIIAWDSRDGRTLAEFKYAPAFNTFSSVADKNTMRLVCSIANEPGLLVHDLKTGGKANRVAEELGVVEGLEATYDFSALLVHSTFRVDGLDIYQISVCDTTKFRVISILVRRKKYIGSRSETWRIEPKKGVLAGEIERGMFVVANNMVKGRAPYIYLENEEYDIHKQRQHLYLENIRMAEIELTGGNYDACAKRIRAARQVPGYIDGSEAEHIWASLSGKIKRSGVNEIKQRLLYVLSGSLEWDSFSGPIKLHPDGKQVIVVCTGLSRGSIMIDDPKRVLIFNPANGGIQILADDLPNEVGVDAIATYKTCEDAVNIVCGGKRKRYLTYLNSKGEFRARYDRGPSKYNDYETVESIAVSDCCTYVACAFGNWRFTENAETNWPKAVLIWKLNTQTEQGVIIHSQTAYANGVSFLTYNNSLSIIFGSNIGVQICSVHNTYKPVLIQTPFKVLALKLSTCGNYVAASFVKAHSDKNCLLQVFDLVRGVGAPIFSSMDEPRIRAMEFTPEATILIALDESGILRFYSIQDARCVKQHNVHGENFSMSHDGESVCVVSRKRIAMYDIEWDY